MIDFILLLIIGSLWIWGFRAPFQEGYFLFRLGETMRKDIGKWFAKPHFDCAPCMSSIHGLLISVTYYGWDIKIPIYIICLCGLNYIIKEWLFPEYE